MVRPSHSEDDHSILLVASVLSMRSKPVTDESYGGSELLVTGWTRQKTLVWVLQLSWMYALFRHGVLRLSSYCLPGADTGFHKEGGGGGGGGGGESG